MEGYTKMSMDKYMFTSSVIIKVPQLLPYCDRIEKIEFWDESSKLARLVEYMFKNAESTNPHMNRIIVYTLSICIVKAIETKRGFILLFNEGTLSPAFLLNRSIFEIWAAAYFVEKNVESFRSTRNAIQLANIADRLFAGAIYPAQLPWGESSTEKPVHISKMIKELKQQYSEAKQTYSFLSEYCHPNFLYNEYANLASFQHSVWDNPKFLESISTALEKQLASLEQSLIGIKASVRAITQMCCKEYGID